MPEYNIEFIDIARKHKTVRISADSKQDAKAKAITPEGFRFLQIVSIDDLAKAQAKYNRELRMRLIEAYGGACQCPGGCPITIPEFLNLDHVNNNGTEERAKYGAGSRFYRWLKKQGWPKDGNRLLCYNCNMSRAKQKDKRCPHERINRTRRIRAISSDCETT